MAMGLNHYLKYYCLTTVSWYADIAVEIPEELPMVGEKVISEASRTGIWPIGYLCPSDLRRL